MQKVKGIKLACLAAFAILPIQAYALGVGKLTMHSALDEPLNASIELTAVTATELQSLEVKLGSAGVFNMAGIDRNEQLKSISFSLVKENGKDLIRLKTEQPFRDPFLHFIINASWANGSMLREYTALLDPPSYLSGAPARIQAPAVATPVAVQPAPAPVPVAAAKTEQAPSSSSAAVDAQIPPADSVERKLGPTDIGISETSYSSDMRPGSTYGPVKNGDVLWNIAEEVKADSQMGMAQIMMAIFKQNPKAFMNNNINLIRAGQTLQIPSESEITSTSRSAAQEELRVQMAEWQEYKDDLSSGSRVAETESAVADKEMPDAAEKETADETTSEATAEKDDSATSTGAMESSAEEQDVLEIVRAKVDATDSSGSGASAEELAEYESAITAYKENVGLLEESLASSELEKQDLSERVALLEQQIDKANKLIDMQNADLARLQAQGQGQTGDVVPVDRIDLAEKTEVSPVAPAPDAAPIASDASPIAPDVTPAVAEKSIYESTKLPPADVAAVTPVKPPVPEVKEPPVVEKPSAAEKKAAKTRVRPAPAAEDKGFVASITDFVTSSWMTMLGSALALLLVLVGLFVVLRRRRSIAEFEDSIISGTAVLDISTAESSEPTESGSETSFLSDFVPGMGNMQADEVDPLAEAEVYMAYGRDEQAEEVLKDAASKTPDRHELKLKLLEIYQSRKDVSSFETLAEELYPADGNIPMAVWAKVAEMGKIVNPENPLFQGDIKIQEDTLFGDKERKEDVPLGDLLDTDTIDAEEAELMEALNEDISEENSEEADEQIIEGITEEVIAESDDLSVMEAIDDFEMSENTVEIPDHEQLDEITKVDDFPVPDEEVLNMDLGDFTPDVEQETDSLDLDTLGVNLGDLGDELDAVTEESVVIDEGEIDFNLDGIDLDLGESSDTEETALDMSGLEGIEGLDLDLESDDNSEDSSSDGINIDSDNDTSAISLQDETLEFADLGDLTLTDENNDSALDIESGDDDSAELPAGANETWDEAGTKLDLARAYIEMDDKESARSILEEVVKEGSDDQTSEARDLINQIDAG